MEESKESRTVPEELVSQQDLLAALPDSQELGSSSAPLDLSEDDLNELLGECEIADEPSSKNEQVAKQVAESSKTLAEDASGK